MLAYETDETPTSALDRDAVAVQRALNQRLGAGLVEDGVLGPQTHAAIQTFQRVQGLPPTGVLTPDTQHALLQGARPPGATAPALVRQETAPPSRTLYVRLPLGGEGQAPPLTGIFFPDQYPASATIDVLLYLHGHRQGQPTMAIDTYWKQAPFRFREALNGTHTPLVLVAPTLGLTSDPGWLGHQGGLERYLDQVLEGIRAHGPYGGRQPGLRHLILACHSGGGAPMRRLALNAGRYGPNLRECWGFDCLYNRDDPQLWSAWARAHPQARLYVYWAGSTRELSLALQQRGLPNVTVEKSRNAVHNSVPLTYWAERILGWSAAAAAVPPGPEGPGEAEYGWRRFTPSRAPRYGYGRPRSAPRYGYAGPRSAPRYGYTVAPYTSSGWRTPWFARRHVGWPSTRWGGLDVTAAPAYGGPSPGGSEYIRWVQKVLNQIMGLRLPVDGVMGRETRSALRQFQAQQGLPVNGVVGPDTERALLAAQAPPPGAPAPDAAPPPGAPDQAAEYATLEREYFEQEEDEVNRHSPDYIRWVQQALNQILGLQLAVDGIIGSMTRSAARRFQQQHGLGVDGIVGPQTEAALIAAGAGNPPGSGTLPVPPPGPVPPPPAPQTLRAKAAQIAVQEWLRWGKGTIKESDSSIRPVLEDYWRTGAGSVPSEPNWWSSIAWSAVFISWVMRKAGAGGAFRYSSGHTDYVGAAKRNRLANNSNPFKAYRITEVAPRVGDLVCVERKDSNGNWSGVTYDNVDQGFRASHCDIVTEVQPGKLKTIGGNVSNSVSQKTIRTDANGCIIEPRYYAVVCVGA